MPWQASGSTDMQYYSYTVGPLHVIALSGESSRLNSQDSVEMVWLMNDLKAASAVPTFGAYTSGALSQRHGSHSRIASGGAAHGA